ncbi:MAG: hypothetical protein A3D31_00115 [Candidatus Fluviicola riflensis]|nr:MAG: hypothetical protein CHH17_05430 [Candidatus Fluviicola riflensis]OGS76015.1 MAG: hypothetical protein A3D31_00115 [Candidatus Fluviicola riflensis]
MNNMKKNLLIASLLLSGAASAQFTQANEPAIGASQAMYELEETADPYAGITGAGVTWDYSSYFGMDNSPRTFSIIDPATTPHAATFSTSTKAISIEGFITTFISSDASTRISQGFAYVDGTDTTVVDLSSNTELLMNYPMALSNSLVDTYGGDVNTTLAPTPFTCTGNDVATVDGSGTLILNSSTTISNVLRYHLADTANATVPIIGEVQIIRSQYEYYDLGNNSNMPVFIYSSLGISIGGNPPTETFAVLSSVAPDGFLGVNTEELAGISVYPNPATETISVDGLTADAQLTLVDAQGKTVASKAVEAGFASMNVDAVTAGVYFLHVTSNELTTVERVVIR